MKQPTRGDWVSKCLKDLKYLEISETFKEIEIMTKAQFNRLLKDRINGKAFKYLTEKQGTKGGHITYVRSQMAEYLLPDSNLSITQKRRLFSIRNMMLEIPENFSSDNIKTFCVCGEREVMSHIYYCDILNQNNSELISYERIYNGSISEQIIIYHTFEEHFERREQMLTESESTQSINICEIKKRKKPPCDPSVDPLHCKMFSNG